MTEANAREERPIRWPSLLGYGLGDFGFLLVWHGSALFLLYFYTDILGIAPELAGLIYLAAMIWDAVSDPLVAAWAERRAALSGRYSPIIAWAALPVGLAYGLMYLAPAEGWTLAVWALISHLAFRTAYTVASMPYNTLPVRLTTDGRARTSLSAFRVAGAASGAVVTAILTPVIVQTALEGELSERAGYQAAAIAVGALTALFLFLSGRMVREPVRRSAPSGSGYRDAMTGLFRAAAGNPPLVLLIAVMVVATMGHGFFTQTLLYFMTHVIGRPDAITLVLGLSALATILGAPVWALLAARTSKRTALMAGLLTAAAGYMLLLPASSGVLTLPLAGVFIAGAGGAAVPVMLWSMAPDAIEFGEARTGRRIEARTFGLITFAQKTTVGLTALFAGLLLALSGYEAAAAPDEPARLAMRAMASWIPALFMAGLALAVRAYPISEAVHKQTLETLAERRSPRD